MIQRESFEISLPQFEGPFDLLLFFIERDELDIHDIAVAKITGDFLDYIHHMHTLNIELASEFIVVAATLMRIKAKMLLPRMELNDEGTELDLKKDLIQKLIEYKRFKIVSEDLLILEEERFKQEKRGNILLDIGHVTVDSEPGEDLHSIDLYKLMLLYERSMEKYKQRHAAVKHTVTQYPYTIEEQKKVLGELLKINQQLDFQQIARHSEGRIHFVFNFLALLEMLQQHLISIQLGLGYNNFSVSASKNLSGS